MRAIEGLSLGRAIRHSVAVLSILVVGLFMTSCDGISFLENQDLLQAPMLNLEQKAVYEALEATLDTGSIVYQYPRTGNYRSPFAFFDFDDDGIKEAVVLYSERQDQNEIFAKVLRQDESGNWYSFRDLAGHGNQVDFIEFVPMLSEGEYSLVIGWQNSKNPQQNYMGVYPVALEKEAQDAFVLGEIMEPYDDYVLADFDGDGLYELVLSRKVRSGAQEIALFRKGKAHLLKLIVLH